MIVRLLIVCLTFLSGAAVLAKAGRSEIIPLRTSLSSFPRSIGEWNGQPGERFDPKVLAVLGVDEYANLVFTRGTELPVALYIGYYESQRQGDSIHSPMNCLPGAGWQPLSSGRMSIQVDEAAGAGQPSEPRTIVVNRYLIQKGLDRQLVLYWYQSHGRIIASEYTSKVLMVWDAVRVNRTDAALVRVVTPIDGEHGGDHDAELRATSFVKAMFPRLRAYLPS